jgi:hypothetical protein
MHLSYDIHQTVLGTVLGTTIQENQPAAQIAARYNIFFSDGAIYVMNLFYVGGN